MPTYPLPTLAPIIGSTGISAPTYEDIYQSLIAHFQVIYGSDIYITPDSQDGQFLAIIAAAINDSNQSAIAVFNGYSPVYAQGGGLSAQVKINGITRLSATNSQAVGNVVGVVGTVITNGVVRDVNGRLWNLPVSVTIPGGGVIAVTVTAQDLGNISAGVGSINQIYNPQLGWQSFTNTSPATEGNPIETDAELRIRQASSVSLPALGIKGAILAAIGNVPGVIRHTVYENDTAVTDSNGVPAHSFSAVVEGGSVMAIATAINGRKPPGIQTYGTTSQIVLDEFDLPTTINFFVLAEVRVYFAITIKALPTYVSTTADKIKAALLAFITGLGVGETVRAVQASAAASLPGTPEGLTFYITIFKLDTITPPVGTGDVAILFNQAAETFLTDISISVI